MSKKIELHPYGRNRFAIVDDDVYDELSRFRWCWSKGYARRRYTDKATGKIVSVWMHRIINRTPSHLDTDHINGVTFDNRRVNLRSVTHQQNMCNMRRRTRSSHYHGVYFDRKSEKWLAALTTKGIRKNLGYFDNPHHAALTFNWYTTRIRRGISVLNEIDETVMSVSEQEFFLEQIGRSPRNRSNNTSGFIGVSRKKGCVRWGATIGQKGKKKSLGRFATAEEAARAYDKAALKLSGVKARLNFPLEHIESMAP